MKSSKKTNRRRTRDPQNLPPILLLDKRGTARSLNVCVRTVERLFYSGILPGTRIRRRVLFHVKDVQELARRGCTA